MTKRITFTPTRAQAHIIEGYRKAYKLDKPQDVLSAGLAQLEKAEKVRAYNQLASQMQVDASPEHETAEARKEHVYGEQTERESEVRPPRSPLPSGHDGGAE
jgi:hypothetical protein